MSLRAHQPAAQRSDKPRAAEYRLFAQVNRALADLKAKPREDVAAWIDVLYWNCRIWATLAGDCSNPSNALPASTRAQIISLSGFVRRHTSGVMRREADVETLIELNHIIMQGLAARPDAA